MRIDQPEIFTTLAVRTNKRSCHLLLWICLFAGTFKLDSGRPRGATRCPGQRLSPWIGCRPSAGGRTWTAALWRRRSIAVARASKRPASAWPAWGGPLGLGLGLRLRVCGQAIRAYGRAAQVRAIDSAEPAELAAYAVATAGECFGVRANGADGMGRLPGEGSESQASLMLPKIGLWEPSRRLSLSL